ncbi:putative RNA-dependent RNA polymerase [Dillard's Draw virus]|uniref:Replicase n=1 Tax=Dillard's Draw virus TaxID=2315722 RepID=A0A385KKY4_9RHAB|nr:putative RNA-dependent RNA polymerase [Dillard's Draw virus]AXZ78339.1 putative RNA-dependent RNA polymerase [Dillard's Draw virus]
MDDYDPLIEDTVGPDRRKPKRLNLTDYCLQSPLLTEVQDKISQWKNRELSSLDDDWMFVLRRTKDEIKSWTETHKWFGSLLLSIKEVEKTKTPYLNLWRSFSSRDAKIADSVVQSFAQGIDLSIKNFSRIDDVGCEGYGEIGLVCHLLICVMNNIKNPCFKKITGDTMKREVMPSGKVIGIWDHPLLGIINFNQDFATVQGGYLLEKNFIMMMKDVTLGRYCICVGENIIGQDMKFIKDVWIKGDEEMKTFGNEVYDSIKLIEALCSERMIQLGQEKRPAIRIPSDFSDFLQTTTDELESAGRTFPKWIRERLKETDDVELVIEIYGMFRIWGHPYIDLLKGLDQLHHNVTLKKNIDEEFANQLASDLAYKVLENRYKIENKWYVDKTKLSEDCKIRGHILEDTWPTPLEIQEFGDNFHNLPLIPCFEIPDFVDPSMLMGDKAHSLQLEDVIKDIEKGGKGMVKTERVLKTFLNKEQLDVKEFLKNVEEKGFSKSDLVIGLKAKERELKIIGRYFALMSWLLRTYFVLTELLIKEHFIPLFDGITMADDLKNVIGKMISRSDGQGRDDYKEVTYANHMDYSKWNNHQRGKINNPTFRVMGQFLGYPNLIVRTHEIFEQSLVYYAGDKTLLKVVSGTVVPSGTNISCWQGQAGGLEGLRQKGWTITSLLMIERVSRMRNTKITTLAQGDNQIVCCSFKLSYGNDEAVMKSCLDEIYDQNKKIMMDIQNNAQKMGLIIKMEETMTSTELINYGKNIVYRGNLCNPKSKRFARMCTLNNDCLPNFANCLSTTSSLSLSIGHFDFTPLNGIRSYITFGSMGINLLSMYDPCLDDRILTTNRKEFVIRSLFMDPSIGGVCGVNLNRFLIRSFPDPVTEALSFWKIVGENTKDPLIMKVAIGCFNPNVSRGVENDITLLIENPTSLNIPSGLSPTNLIRQEIKLALFQKSHSIKNKLVQDVTKMAYKEDSLFISFVKTISPLFPRLLSQLKTGTVIGIRDSITGIYENSRTIRKEFCEMFRDDFDDLVIRSEHQSLKVLDKTAKQIVGNFKCSSIQADALRKSSWGSDIIGVTIPHPCEVLLPPKEIELHDCTDHHSAFITTVSNKERKDVINGRGPCVPYLGSATSEGTSILTPWEKEAKIPFLKRVMKLRTPIGWFVSNESNLGKSIKNIIEAVVGPNRLQITQDFKRTGSAIHRYGCERQSAGGYSAISPCLLMRLFTTTDTMVGMETKNYDFMFQANIIYSQTLASVKIHNENQGTTIFHSHLKCKTCVREIQDITVDSKIIYNPDSFYQKIKEWMPTIDDAWRSRVTAPILTGNVEDYTRREITFNVGQTIGFVFTHMFFQGKVKDMESALFPVTLRNKLDPEPFLNGLVAGIAVGSATQFLSNKIPAKITYPKEGIVGVGCRVINSLVLNPSFLSLVKEGPLSIHMAKSAHKTPASYPTSAMDSGVICKMFLKQLLSSGVGKFKIKKPVMIFSDMIDPALISAYTTGCQIYESLTASVKNVKQMIRLKNTNISNRSKKDDLSVDPTLPVILISSEIRHLAKFNIRLEIEESRYQFGQEWTGDVYSTHLEFSPEVPTNTISVPQVLNPIVGICRLAQMATGSHYKVRSIINHYKMSTQFFLSGGDGSGGITSAILRHNKQSKGIFNSLLILEGVTLKGSAPSPPAAVYALGPDRNRCINLNTCWRNPSDLSEKKTWEYFKTLVEREGKKLDLIVLDMEITEREIALKICTLLCEYGKILIKDTGNVIYKTYLAEFGRADGIPHQFAQFFDEMIATQTSATSGNSSEIYLILRQPIGRPITRYISGLSIMKVSATNLVYEEYDSAARRAQVLLQTNPWKGMPKELIPPLDSEAQIALEVLKVPGGIIHTLISSPGKASKPDKCFALISIVDFYMFKTGMTGKLHIPGDQQCKTYMAFLIASLMALECHSDMPKISHLVKYINKGMILKFKQENHRGKKVQAWELSNSGKELWLKDQGSPLNGFGRTMNRILGSTLMGGDAIFGVKRTKALKLTGILQVAQGKMIPRSIKQKGAIYQGDIIKSSEDACMNYE